MFNVMNRLWWCPWEWCLRSLQSQDRFFNVFAWHEKFQNFGLTSPLNFLVRLFTMSWVPIMDPLSRYWHDLKKNIGNLNLIITVSTSVFPSLLGLDGFPICHLSTNHCDYETQFHLWVIQYCGCYYFIYRDLLILYFHFLRLLCRSIVMMIAVVVARRSVWELTSYCTVFVL